MSWKLRICITKLNRLLKQAKQDASIELRLYQLGQPTVCKWATSERSCWHGRRLGVEFGGRKKISRTEFSNDLLRKNCRSYRSKFLMPFLVIINFSRELFYFVCLLPVSSGGLKFLLETIFTQFVLYLTSYNSTSLNIGGRMHGPFLQVKFGGPWPRVPLSLRPCLLVRCLQC